MECRKLVEVDHIWTYAHALRWNDLDPTKKNEAEPTNVCACFMQKEMAHHKRGFSSTPKLSFARAKAAVELLATRTDLNRRHRTHRLLAARTSLKTAQETQHSQTSSCNVTAQVPLQLASPNFHCCNAHDISLILSSIPTCNTYLLFNSHVTQESPELLKYWVLCKS